MEEFQIESSVYWLVSAFVIYIIYSWRRSVVHDRAVCALKNNQSSEMRNICTQGGILYIKFRIQNAAMIGYMVFVAGYVGETHNYIHGIVIVAGILIWGMCTSVAIQIANDGEYIICVAKYSICGVLILRRSIRGRRLLFIAEAIYPTGHESARSQIAAYENDIKYVVLRPGWPATWKPIANHEYLELVVSLMNKWCQERMNSADGAC